MNFVSGIGLFTSIFLLSYVLAGLLWHINYVILCVCVCVCTCCECREQEREMVVMAGACEECIRNCQLTHRNKMDLSPSVTRFFKVLVGDDFSQFLVCKLISLTVLYGHSLFSLELSRLFFQFWWSKN